jgi:hypothetical protein
MLKRFLKATPRAIKRYKELYDLKKGNLRLASFFTAQQAHTQADKSLLSKLLKRL